MKTSEKSTLTNVRNTHGSGGGLGQYYAMYLALHVLRDRSAPTPRDSGLRFLFLKKCGNGTPFPANRDFFLLSQVVMSRPCGATMRRPHLGAPGGDVHGCLCVHTSRVENQHSSESHSYGNFG